MVTETAHCHLAIELKRIGALRERTDRVPRKPRLQPELADAIRCH